MVKDADKVLQEYLLAHPELREEWELNQKLKNDPRITRVGRYFARLAWMSYRSCSMFLLAT